MQAKNAKRSLGGDLSASASYVYVEYVEVSGEGEFGSIFKPPIRPTMLQ